MTPPILVTCASKHGATAEIAERIGAALRAEGLAVEVIPVDQAPDPASYSAVILGSAVYAGQWMKPAAEFLTRHEAALSARPVWLFSTGPTGEGDPVELMKGFRFPTALQPIADRIHPRDTAFFHGVIDMHDLNFAEKLLVKGIKAPIGDFRDWDMIENWSKAIAAALRQTV